MKKAKKIFTSLICAVMVFSSIAALPVYAEQSRIAVLHCPECITGALYMYPNSRKYQHDETFPCTHGKEGEDVYKVYEVKERGYCDSCSYTYTNSYEEHVYKSCNGK